MIYSTMAVITTIIGLGVAYMAAKLLLKHSWLLGWLRGMLGLALLVLAGAFTMAAWDVYSYQQIKHEQVVATLSFEKLQNELYKVTLADNNGHEQIYRLKGDQWQLDARIIKWRGFMASAGISPGYRLSRLSGRYYSLAKERTKKHTVFALHQSHYGVDVWQWLRKTHAVLPLADAVYGSATYLPMADGALFEVSLSATGLLARPLNEPAKRAVGLWQ